MFSKKIQKKCLTERHKIVEKSDCQKNAKYCKKTEFHEKNGTFFDKKYKILPKDTIFYRKT